jgi:hypothetical protein
VLPLLQHLYQSWFSYPQARRFQRRIVTARVEVIVGASAIHRALGSTLARRTLERGLAASSAPGQVPPNASQADDMDKDPTITDWERGPTPPALERWDLLDEGPDGFRIRRREVGAPINDRQLVAIKPTGAKSFMLAQTRWLMTGIDGSISLGLHALAGLPQSVMIHMTRASGGSTKTLSVPGFTLSKANDSLSMIVAARGSLHVGASVEIESNSTILRARLSQELENGHDFDLLTYITLQP